MLLFAFSSSRLNRTEGVRGRYTRPSPRMRRRDFMGARDPAEAVEVLDRLLNFFGDGERRGNRCLVGALDFVSSHHAIESDEAERYLADEISAAGDCHDAGADCAS